MQRTDFHFDLPAGTHCPAARRRRARASRLLRARRRRGNAAGPAISRFARRCLNAGGSLVFNDTRVMPARVHGTKESGGQDRNAARARAHRRVRALVHARASKGLKPRARGASCPAGQRARMLERDGELFRLRILGRRARFLRGARRDAAAALHRPRARVAPIANATRRSTRARRARSRRPPPGLHFDAAIFAALERRRVRHAFVTLHVGRRHLPAGAGGRHRASMKCTRNTSRCREAACAAINATRAAGGRVIAVGTTVVRSLETAAAERRQCRCGRIAGATRIFIKPGYRFRVVDAMVTNFHLPESTLADAVRGVRRQRRAAGGLRARGARRGTGFSATVMRCS